MNSSRLLTKSSSRCNNNSIIFQKSKTPVEVNTATKFLGFSLEGGGSSDTRISIHGTVDGVGLDARDLVEGIRHVESTALQGDLEIIPFLLVAFVGGITLFGRAEHQVHGELPNGVGGEMDGGHLDELGHDFRFGIQDFHVSTTKTTFTDFLGCRVHGDEETLLGFRRREFSEENFTEGMETFFLSVDVALIDFIGDESDLLLDGPSDDFLDALTSQDTTSRISRIDDFKNSRADTVADSRIVGAIEFFDGDVPLVAFVEVVGNDVSVVDASTNIVERVSGNRRHQTRLLDDVSKEDVEDEGDSHGGASSHDDLFRIGIRDHAGISTCLLGVGDITFHHELADVLADARPSSGGAVRTNTSTLGAVVDEPASTSNDVGLELGSEVGVIEKMRNARESENFTDEGEGLHANHEGVTKVGADDLLEGIFGGTLFYFSIDLIGTNKNGTTIFELDFTNAIGNLRWFHFVVKEVFFVILKKRK